jgi:hypothetical protein
MNYFLPDNALAILNQNWQFSTESSKYFGKGIIFIAIEKIYSNLLKSRGHAHEFTRYALFKSFNSTPPWVGGALEKIILSWIDRLRGDKSIHTSIFELSPSVHEIMSFNQIGFGSNFWLGMGRIDGIGKCNYLVNEWTEL